MRPGNITDFQPIRGLEIVSDRHTENQHTVRPCSMSSENKRVSKSLGPKNDEIFRKLPKFSKFKECNPWDQLKICEK